MDELLINACLQERNPSNLPWSIDGKEKNKEIDSVDKSTSTVDKGIFTKIEYNQRELEKLDERKCNDGSRYKSVDQGVYLQNGMKSVGVSNVTPSQVESKDNKADLTYFGDSRLSMKDVSHSTNESIRKIPMLYTFNNQRLKQGANSAAVCLSEGGPYTRSNIGISPKCSLKVSRKMIQESKLDDSVPLRSERSLLKRKGEMSISSGSTLKKDNKYETKQMKQGQINANLQGNGRLQKILDRAETTSTASWKRKNYEIVSNKPHTCMALDMNVDNELDDLLELTADAINYRSNKAVKVMESVLVNGHLIQTQSKDKRNNHVDSRTIKAKDCKSQGSSVPRNLASAGEVNDAENSEIRNENESEPKSLKQNEWDKAKYSYEKGAVAVEYHRENTLDGMYPIDDIKKRRAEHMRVKELGKRYKREVTQDIRYKLYSIDGIRVEEFDKEAREPQRKKPNTKTIKKRKRQEKKENWATIETEIEPRNTRRIRRNNAKDNKYNQSISIGNPFVGGMCKERPLIEKSHNEEDIFDISPIKNKETLSDLEGEGSNTYGNHMEHASDLMKRLDRKENKKSDRVDNLNSNVTKLIPEQIQKVPPKEKSKRNKRGNTGINTIKRKDTKPVDRQISHKKQKKKKHKHVSKTSIKDVILPPEESTGRNKSVKGRPSMKTCGLDHKTKTNAVNLHEIKADEDMTHNVVDDQNDCNKTRHKLKSTKSYTVIKHDINNALLIECKTHKDRGSGNPIMRQHMNPRKVKAENDGKIITGGDLLKQNGDQYQKLSKNTRKDDDVKTTNVAKTKECNNQGNSNNFQDMKICDLICDSDKDSDRISDIQYQQYLINRPSSEASSEFEFPRPSSNRTFIIDSVNENQDESKSLHEETMCCNQQGNEEEKKLSKLQRLINFITCCFRPKTDQ